VAPRNDQSSSKAPVRKIGRPPKVKAAETRERLVAIARTIFADRGYEVATNKEIAEAAGFTTAALYYHFPSKLDLYLTVYADTQERIYQRFEADTGGIETFAERLDAVMESAHAMNAEDPSWARFVGAVRVDMRRHPEMFEGYRAGTTVRESFFERLVNFGVSTGEIAKEDRGRAHNALLAFLIGLNDAMSDDQRAHQDAIDGMRALLDGSLLQPPTTKPNTPRRTTSRHTGSTPVRAMSARSTLVAEKSTRIASLVAKSSQ
jgi:AcrR family transcriptional regulator